MTAPAEQYAAAMAQLTAARTGQMLDTCRVTRPAEMPQTPDLDADGNVIVPPPTVVYEGPSTISDPTSAQISGRTSNDQSGVPSTRFLKVPHGADLQSGDLLTVTASAFSPGLVGDTFVVLGEEERTFATYRRYQLRGSSWLSPVVGP